MSPVNQIMIKKIDFQTGISEIHSSSGVFSQAAFEIQKI